MVRDVLMWEDTSTQTLDETAEESEGAVIRTPTDTLQDSRGIIARDVKTKKGAVLLPAGVDIALFATAMKTIVQRMKQEGIEHVYLRVHHEISDSELNKIIEKVYTEGSGTVGKEKAATVIKGVGNMFRNIREEEISPEMIGAISNMSMDLTEDLLKNPNIAFSLGKVKEADEYTFVHSFNVAVLTGYLVGRLHPGDKEYLHRVVMGGLIHDMGKAKISNEILNKPGALTAEEFAEMKKHTNYGMVMALKADVRDPVLINIIGAHHEKWSGKGYPKGTKGTEIPEAARIAAVADVFDALTAKRVYKSSMSSRNAITLILKDAGIHFDAKVARELLVSLGLYPPGSVVMLSDGRNGIVVSGGGKDLIRPVVIIQEDENESNVPVFLDLKTTPDIRISHYIGHGEKRDLGYNFK